MLKSHSRGFRASFMLPAKSPSAATHSSSSAKAAAVLEILETLGIRLSAFAVLERLIQILPGASIATHLLLPLAILELAPVAIGVFLVNIAIATRICAVVSIDNFRSIGPHNTRLAVRRSIAESSSIGRGYMPGFHPLITSPRN